MEERRKHVRIALWKTAKLLKADGRVEGCMFVDTSAGGVRVRTSEDLAIGEKFALVVWENDIRIECQTVRRLGHDYGAVKIREMP